MEKISCNRCGQKFESNGASSLCYDCRRKRTPSIYFGIAVAIVIIGFIGGIIMGATNKAITYDDDFNSTESFNTNLMIDYWENSIIVAIIICGIGSINYRLNLIIDNKQEK